MDLSFFYLRGTLLVALNFFKFGAQIIQFRLLLLNFGLHCLEMQKKLLLYLFDKVFNGLVYYRNMIPNLCLILLHLFLDTLGQALLGGPARSSATFDRNA